MTTKPDKDRARSWRRLLPRRDGVVTVEFIVWIPVFLVILGFVADACSIYLAQASMWNTARDCVRRMSTGQITSNATAISCVKNNVLFGAGGTSKFTVTPTFGGASGDDSIEVSVPLTKVSIFGVLNVMGGMMGKNLDVKVTMRSEQ